MTPEAQRIAIARKRGWTTGKVIDPHTGRTHTLWKDPSGNYSPPPFYYADLNAMHEAEKIFVPSSEYNLSHYMFELTKIVLPAGTKRCGIISEYMFHATAAQRSEAFLRTLGLWEDDK